ncbi:MAG: hypothetical protein ABJC04_04055 [Verrucomicrobiota bacterium]
MSAQEIINQFKKLPPAERTCVTNFIIESAYSPASAPVPPSKNDAAFALVEDLCGSLSGPTDLATNPKYLESMGE